jgi:uncharacterized protein (DUF2235 family)
MAKNILIFSDGTGQAGGVSLDERRSNIYKLYRATRAGPDSTINPEAQLAFYDAGLGSLPPNGGTFKAAFRTAHNFLSEATGFGLTTNITDCYESIIRLWRPGDRIFLFGFSRGAYTIRCLGGVLAHCGVPTCLKNGKPMKYNAGTARPLAKIAVKYVYQHTASVPLTHATARQKELMEQRNELARQFRETYASRQDDGSDYPFFIGVFDTVASIASAGSLIILFAVVVAVAAVAATVLWYEQSALQILLGSWQIGFLTRLAELVHFDPAPWWPWFVAVLGAIALVTFGWYVMNQVKFAPRANPKRWWRTLNISFRRMSFEDKTLNDNVRYARHAISIDENRAAFKRVGWGDPASTRREKDGQGINTFQQYWFAGNHSDIGGSYPENEARLSDITMQWMIEAAEGIQGGIKIDKSMLQLYPSPGGMQHDQRKEGFPFITKWLRITWPGTIRKIPDPKAPLHDSVYQRFTLPAVLQYDIDAPYRPEGLRMHDRLAGYYKDIPKPKEQRGIIGWIGSFFLTG